MSRPCINDLSRRDTNHPWPIYAFFTAVWKKLEEQKIPFTFHWGKVNELNMGRLTNMYGADVQTWMAARNKLLDADTRKVFTNATLATWGLDKVR